MTNLQMMGMEAKKAARELAAAGCKKDEALKAIARSFIKNTASILSANAADIEAAEKNGLRPALIDRLKLTKERISGIADGVLEVAAMPDPIGTVVSGGRRPNGLDISKVRVPLGVIGIIFEARPNVSADAAALCLKSGNAVILRGGKEAINSNKCLVDIMRASLENICMNPNCINLITDTRRDSAVELMNLSEYLDVLIPRGGAGLIRSVVENAHVPVIETGAGNCHIYIDEDADIQMAANIVYNAKTSRPSVCNAIETILVHKDIAEKALPEIKALLDKKNVELRGCARTREILGNEVKNASEEDWATEYNDYILAIRVVSSFEEALLHIEKYSTGHSECIVTQNYERARRFTNEVDAAAVYVNASTRFTDGGMFGNGAEIGISTQKLHTRGPMGINELTSVKYIINGDGQIRE